MRHEPNVYTLPAELVQQPGNLPAHCSRHGNEAVKRVDFALQSKVEIEGNRALSGNVLSTTDRLGQRAKKVRVTNVKGWPLCRECVRFRAFWLTIALVMFAGGLLAFAGSLLVGIVADTSTVQAFAGVAIVGFVVMIASAFPFHRAGMARLVGAATSADGQSIVIVRPSPAFAAELPRP
ncbi:hypothetical protein SAMN05216266_103252 [Amycolatopsis marina]|uniref:Uncharacterized protein n=1 Tax=Amycolatopsis marina TaxID=490629 RepID=A0A1I0XIL6_9PSEU|nr:hypothetical protein [Amycolatopsis marina]SFB00959.1 hypothetical protein SAMN05216266_103252 [Amycolatopsis marina]